MTTNTPHTTKERVLEKIRNNEVLQTPRLHFRLRIAAVLAVGVAVVVVSLFLSSFILFSIRASGQASLLHFGPPGWQVFVLLFPWKLLVLELALVALLEWLLRSFSLGYKIPVLYLFAGVFVVLALLGVAVDRTTLHDTLLLEADRHHLPLPLHDLYEGARRPPPFERGIMRGEVVSVASTTIQLALDNPRGIGTTTLLLLTFSEGQEPMVEVGERVFVRTERIDGVHVVRDIRSADDVPPPRAELPY